jgi:hypothetical protein
MKVPSFFLRRGLSFAKWRRGGFILIAHLTIQTHFYPLQNPFQQLNGISKVGTKKEGSFA